MTMDPTTCWCGHPASSHRAVLADLTMSRTGVVSQRLFNCEAEWTERGGMDQVHCNCQQYAPAERHT